jgi:hypothetical protein
MPPLIITEAECNQAADVLSTVIDQALAAPGQQPR